MTEKTILELAQYHLKKYGRHTPASWDAPSHPSAVPQPVSDTPHPSTMAAVTQLQSHFVQHLKALLQEALAVFQEDLLAAMADKGFSLASHTALKHELEQMLCACPARTHPGHPGDDEMDETREAAIDPTHDTEMVAIDLSLLASEEKPDKGITKADAPAWDGGIPETMADGIRAELQAMPEKIAGLMTARNRPDQENDLYAAINVSLASVHDAITSLKETYFSGDLENRVTAQLSGLAIPEALAQIKRQLDVISRVVTGLSPKKRHAHQPTADKKRT